jgi:4-amino-4-deoxy-L-arabinose transferase-like glycosyltransferase
LPGPELTLALALALGLFLRWPLTRFDLAHYVGPDEGEVVENVLEMMKTGYYHQRHPGYPGLHFYLQSVPAAGHFLLAQARGEAETLRDLPREGFYRVARRTTLLAGWLTAVLAYFIGRRHYGRWAGAGAGALLALSPLCFRVSNVVSPDLMLMLFATAALGLALAALERPGRRAFVYAGAAVGLATAIKYTGVLLSVPYAAAWLLSGHVRRWARAAALGAAVAVAAFALASPYTFLDLSSTYRGLTQHVGYYQTGRTSPHGELLASLTFEGLGAPAALAALAGLALALYRRERRAAVLFSFPLAYLLFFSSFGRAFPRHAVVVLPVFALLAGRLLMELLSSKRKLAGALVAASLLIIPLIGSVRLGLAARRPSAADRAAAWIEANLPSGSVLLADQYTPRLDAARFRVHRLQVEEPVFAGNYEWVLYSGYPPGISVEGLSPAMRFEPQGSLGNRIILYKVPERASLMGVTLPRTHPRVEMGAGEAPYFGNGWEPAEPWAFGTSRLSRGQASEIYFVLEDAPARLAASFRLSAALAHGEGPSRIEVWFNDRPAGSLEVVAEEPGDFKLVLPAASLSEGLNRLVLRYDRTYRRDRRHRETAIRFYGLRLERE